MTDQNAQRVLERGAGIGGRLDGFTGSATQAGKALAIRARRGRDRADRNGLLADRRLRLRARDRIRADHSDRNRALFCLSRPEGGIAVGLCGRDPDDRDAVHPRLPVGRALRHSRLSPPDQSDGKARLRLVDGLSARHRRHLLRKTRRRIFPRLVRELLRLRPVRACWHRGSRSTPSCAAGCGKAGLRAAPLWSAAANTARV